MRQRNIVLSLAAAGPVVAVLISSCAPAAHNGANSNLTVQCTESLTGQDVTDGGVAGTGHCTLTGGYTTVVRPLTFSQRLSRDHFVLE
jgi:hypothetical protein